MFPTTGCPAEPTNERQCQMAKTKDAARVPAAGKTKGTTNNNVEMTAEIGKVYLTLKRIDGKCLVEISTDCVDPNLTDMADMLQDNHGVQLDMDGIFDYGGGFSETEVAPEVHEAIRRFAANNTNWKFHVDVDDSDLWEI